MKKKLTFIFIFSIFFITKIFSEQEEQNWIVQDVSSISFFDYAQALSLNDNGQVLLKTTINHKDVWAIGSTDSFSMLPILPQIPHKPNSGLHAKDVIWQRINKSNLVIGTREIIDSHHNEITFELVTWKESEEIKKYMISSHQIPYELAPRVAQCENSDHVVITYEGIIYKLQNDKLVELTSELLDKSKPFGLSFYKIKWEGLAVNNKGNVYGKFLCFEKHLFKEKPTFVCEYHFIWDNKDIHIIEIPQNFYIVSEYQKRHFNNNDQVLLRSSCVWDKTNGLIPLNRPTKSNVNYAAVIALLDDGTIVWVCGKSQNLLLQNELSSSSLKFYNQSASKNIDYINYPNLKFSELHTNMINNKKQIIFSGNFLGENHPFLLTPN